MPAEHFFHIFFHVTQSILKSKTKEPLKVLSSSGIRGTKFTPVYNFPAQLRHSFGNQSILSFEVVAVRDIKLKIAFVEKYTFILSFLAILGV